MKERTYPEPISDMAAAAQSQVGELLKCGEAVSAGNSLGGYDPRPYAERAHEEAVAAGAAAKDAGSYDDAARASLRAAEALESRSSEAQRLGWMAEASLCAKRAAAHRKIALEHAAKALELAPKKGMLAKALSGLRDLVKSQVKGYTKKDGTVVQAFSNKVQAKGGDVGLGLWRAGHKVKVHAPGHELHGFSGELSGKVEAEGHNKFAHVKGPAGVDHYVNHHDLRPADGHGWPDLDDDHSQPIRDQKAPVQPGAGDAGGAEGQPGAAAKPKAKASDKALLMKKPKADAKVSGPAATPEQLSQMESSIANDEESSDEEMVEFFVKECGIPEAIAKQAVSHRDEINGMAVPPEGILGKLMKKNAGAQDPVAKKAASDGGASSVPMDAATAHATFPEHKDTLANLKDGESAKITAGDDEHTLTKQGDGFQASRVSRGTGDSPAGKSGASGESGAPLTAEQPTEGGPEADAAANPQADANAAGWGNLPDEENPEHALGGFSSKHLGKLATMPPEHAKAHAHAELRNRGLDSKGEWAGFDQAKAHHGPNIPDGFKPVHGGDPEQNGFQQVHRKVLSAVAQGHLDLQKRAKAGLASRGHDHNGNWVGFKKAKEMHGDGKQSDLFKSLVGAKAILLVGKA